MGDSRSLVLIIAYLVRYRNMEKSRAIALVREKKPELVIKPYLNDII